MIDFVYADKGDLEKIVNIYNQSITSLISTADLEPVSVNSRREWFENHNKNKRPIWIIKYNNQVAGWVSLSDFYGRKAYDITSEISLYIDEDYKGLGLASQALIFVESNLERLGIKNLLAFIFSSNEASKKLFVKNGFEEWGILPRVADMGSSFNDLIIFGKKY